MKKYDSVTGICSATGTFTLTILTNLSEKLFLALYDVYILTIISNKLFYMHCTFEKQVPVSIPTFQPHVTVYLLQRKESIKNVAIYASKEMKKDDVNTDQKELESFNQKCRLSRPEHGSRPARDEYRRLTSTA